MNDSNVTNINETELARTAKIQQLYKQVEELDGENKKLNADVKKYEDNEYNLHQEQCEEVNKLLRERQKLQDLLDEKVKRELSKLVKEVNETNEKISGVVHMIGGRNNKLEAIQNTLKDHHSDIKKKMHVVLICYLLFVLTIGCLIKDDFNLLQGIGTTLPSLSPFYSFVIGSIIGFLAIILIAISQKYPPSIAEIVRQSSGIEGVNNFD